MSDMSEAISKDEAELAAREAAAAPPMRWFKLRRRQVRDWVQRTFRLWWHTVNDGDEYAPVRPLWRGGRFYLYFNHPELRTRAEEQAWHAKRHFAPVLHLEWSLFNYGLQGPAISLRVDEADDSDFTFHLGLFGASFFYSIDRWRVWPVSWLHALAKRKARPGHWGGERELSLRIHDGALWWSLWWPQHEWHRGDPKWRHGSFYPLDFLFGRMVYRSESLTTYNTRVHMPEYSYPMTVVLTRDSWTRPRFPLMREVVHRAECKLTEYAIPKPGKGESSWDCDDDAIYSMTTPATTLDQAVMAVYTSVMRDRVRYGGTSWTCTDHTANPVHAPSAAETAGTEAPKYLVSNGDEPRVVVGPWPYADTVVGTDANAVAGPDNAPKPTPDDDPDAE